MLLLHKEHCLQHITGLGEDSTGASLVVYDDSQLTVAGNVTATCDSYNNHNSYAATDCHGIGLLLGENAHIVAGITAETTTGAINNGILTLYGNGRAAATLDTLNEEYDEPYDATINGMADGWCYRVNSNWGEDIPGMPDVYDTYSDVYNLALSHSSDDGALFRRGICWNYVNTGIDSNELLGNSCEIWEKTIVGSNPASHDPLQEFYWETYSYNYRAARFELGHYPVWVGGNQVTFDDADDIYTTLWAPDESVVYYQADVEHPVSVLALSNAAIYYHSDENASHSNYFKYRRLGLNAGILAYEDLIIDYSNNAYIYDNSSSIPAEDEDLSRYGIYGLYGLMLNGADEAVLGVYAGDAKIAVNAPNGELQKVVTAGIGSAHSVLISGGAVYAKAGNGAVGAYSAGIYCCDGFDTDSEYEIPNQVTIINSSVAAIAGSQDDDNHLRISAGINADIISIEGSTVSAIAKTGNYGIGLMAKGLLMTENSSINVDAWDKGIEVLGVSKMWDAVNEMEHNVPTIYGRTPWTVSDLATEASLYATNTDIVVRNSKQGVQVRMHDIYQEGGLLDVEATAGSGIVVEDGEFYACEGAAITVEAAKNGQSEVTYGIYVDVDFDLDSNSVVNVNVKNHADGIAYSDYGIYTVDDVLAEDSVITAYGQTKNGIFAHEDVEIDGGEVFAQGAETGIYADDNIEIEGVTVTAIGLNYIGIYAQSSAAIYGSNIVAEGKYSGISVIKDIDIYSSTITAIKGERYGIYTWKNLRLSDATANLKGGEYGIYANEDVVITAGSIIAVGASEVGIKADRLFISEDPSMTFTLMPTAQNSSSYVKAVGDKFGVQANEIRLVQVDEVINQEFFAGHKNATNETVVLDAKSENGTAIKVGNIVYDESYASEGGLALYGHGSMVRAISSDSAIVGQVYMQDGYIYASSTNDAISFVSNSAIASNYDFVLNLDFGYKVIRTSTKAGVHVDDYNVAANSDMKQLIDGRLNHKFSFADLCDETTSKASFVMFDLESSIGNSLPEAAKTVEIYYPATALVQTQQYQAGVFEVTPGCVDVPLREMSSGSSITPYEIIDKVSDDHAFKLDAPQALDIDKWFTFDASSVYGTEAFRDLAHTYYDSPSYYGVYPVAVGSIWADQDYEISELRHALGKELNSHFDGYFNDIDAKMNVAARIYQDMKRDNKYIDFPSICNFTINGYISEHTEYFSSLSEEEQIKYAELVKYEYGLDQIFNGPKYHPVYSISSVSALTDNMETEIVWKNDAGHIVVTEPITSMAAFVDTHDEALYGIAFNSGVTPNIVTFSGVTIDTSYYAPHGAALELDTDTRLVLSDSNVIDSVLKYGDSYPDGINASDKLSIDAVNNGNLVIRSSYYGMNAHSVEYINGGVDIEAGVVAIDTDEFTDDSSSARILGTYSANYPLERYIYSGGSFVPESNPISDYETAILQINAVNVTGLTINDGVDNRCDIKTNDGSTARVITLYAVVAPSEAVQSVYWTKSNENITLSRQSGNYTVVTVPDGLADGDYYVKAETVGTKADGTTIHDVTYTIHVYTQTSGGGGGGGYSGGGGGGSYTPAKKTVDEIWRDVDPARYYYKAMQWCYDNNIMPGETSSKFGVGSFCTRGDMVEALYEAAGRPAVSSKDTVPFTDVSKSDSYYKAVVWAYKNGYTTGVTETLFVPDAVLNRAQIVTFLWRYDGSEVVKGKIDFKDVRRPSYYEKAVDWATANGYVNGVSETMFCPEDGMLKEAVMTYFYRYFVEALK